MSPILRIAIVGGGPSGLTLAVLLHRRGIPFTLFELSPKPADADFDKPSGSLDIHEDTGLAAIKDCGLYDQFISLTGDCTEAQRVATSDGNIVYADKGETSNRPEISRLRLTELLIAQLPTSAIKWGHKLLGARKTTPSESGATEIELDFGTNGKETYDIAIGADGAWSQIRNILTDVKPLYAGIQSITLNLRQISSRYPHLSELVGRGTFSCLGYRHGVFSQRSSVQDSARIYIFISSGDEQMATTSGLLSQTPTQAKGYLLSSPDAPFNRWGTNIKELISAACDDETANNDGLPIDIKPLYRLPVGHTWEHQQGATLLGDAAHLMCPWAGEGVNLAMNDSLQLSRAVIAAFDTVVTASTTISTPASDITTAKPPETESQYTTAPSRSETSQSRLRRQLQQEVDRRIQNFETKMTATARIEAQGTLENGEMMFGNDNAANAMAEFFKSAGRAPEL